MTKKAKKVKDTGPVNDLSLAVSVSDRVQIRDVRLLKCNCFQGPLAGKGKQRFQLSYKADTKVDKEGGIINVLPAFRLKGFPEENVESEPVLIIEAFFLLSYKLESLKGLSQENFEHFGRINGIYNAWPYWREFVQNTVARMGLPRLALPVFRIGVEGKPKKTSHRKSSGGKAKKTKSKKPGKR